ncbi:hypothetical protein B0T16DRAFT_454187 [Cercophora newfieldiana]|uniref:Methyltransferase type 11 domain-containing protein n=1 Tax=Cercophora newfieldiana TaxID=92897 RepID=A0AA39YHQ3_9PEZI|nr:hypothetical protein B0T16DRAFT_454187 [Cercophora newfieldiana]
MFDVDWADHSAERVGQRRARKEGEREQKKKDERRSVRDSVSSQGSHSSRDKSQGFLGSLGLKLSSASLRSKRHSPSTLKLPTDDIVSKRASTLSQPGTLAPIITSSDDGVAVPESKLDAVVLEIKSDVVVPESKSSAIVPPIDGSNLGGATEPSDNSTNRSSKGSVLSKSTATTALTVPSPCKGSAIDPICIDDKTTQATEPGILVTKTTETTYEPRDDIKPAETQMAAIATPSMASAPFASTPSYLAPLSPTSPNAEVSTSVLIDKWFTSVNSPGSPLSPVMKDEPFNGKNPQVPFGLEPAQESFSLKPPSAMVDKTARSPRRKNTNSSTKQRANNPDAWKPPDNWDSQSTTSAKKLTTPSSSPRRQDASQHPMSLDLKGMQREIARMAVASAEIVTVRLNENWGNSSDGAFYRELEMEKKRWMLSALHNMQRYTEGAGCTDPNESSKDSGEGKRILALFESQATASYLAALYPEGILTHISPQPLSPNLFPNVQALPLAVSGLLPLVANRYSKVYCLCMPSMMPSQDIPRLLRSVHRCLAPKGSLHLTVIDPSPATHSLGPKMRHWLDQNLILHLEAQFRCISPSRLLPAWLADARLRADGSVISRMKCYAVCKPGQNGVGIEAQLRSTVGRKLWQEVWGGFVLGANWWWDDPECVEECMELGTYFEYSLIEAVKDTV